MSLNNKEKSQLTGISKGSETPESEKYIKMLRLDHQTSREFDLLVSLKERKMTTTQSSSKTVTANESILTHMKPLLQTFSQRVGLVHRLHEILWAGSFIQHRMDTV